MNKCSICKVMVEPSLICEMNYKLRVERDLECGVKIREQTASGGESPAVSGNAGSAFGLKSTRQRKELMDLSEDKSFLFAEMY